MLPLVSRSLDFGSGGFSSLYRLCALSPLFSSLFLSSPPIPFHLLPLVLTLAEQSRAEQYQRRATPKQCTIELLLTSRRIASHRRATKGKGRPVTNASRPSLRSSSRAHPGPQHRIATSSKGRPVTNASRPSRRSSSREHSVGRSLRSLPTYPAAIVHVHRDPPPGSADAMKQAKPGIRTICFLLRTEAFARSNTTLFLRSNLCRSLSSCGL